jgi:hypothetical protein
MFHTKVVEKIKTHMLRSVTFSKIVPFTRKCRKNFRAGQATDDNTAHAHCMLDTYGYKYTHSDCVILIALQLKQWLHESATMLRYTYIACLVFLGDGLKHSSSIPSADHRGFGF